MRFTKTTLLLTMAVATVSFNLRTIAVAIGPVLPELRADLGMSPTLAGLLTAMPTLCFALFGFLALPIAARWGLHRSVLIALGGTWWARWLVFWPTRHWGSLPARSSRWPVSGSSMC